MKAEGPTAPQVEDRLAVREEEAAFLVVREGDPDDWLARFDKAGGFPAREWAENMARVVLPRLGRALYRMTIDGRPFTAAMRAAASWTVTPTAGPTA